jgi:hypothetical protein
LESRDGRGEERRRFGEFLASFGEFLLETFATRRESWRSGNGEDESKRGGLKIREGKGREDTAAVKRAAPLRKYNIKKLGVQRPWYKKRR